jgi:hypothetical protein
MTRLVTRLWVSGDLPAVVIQSRVNHRRPSSTGDPICSATTPPTPAACSATSIPLSNKPNGNDNDLVSYDLVLRVALAAAHDAELASALNDLRLFRGTSALRYPGARR